MTWKIEVGRTLPRRELHEIVGGGSWQNGIAPVRSTPDILVFTDPVSGAAHGYDRFEGLREDGTYAYTGEGQRGDQQFVRGNRILRDSAEDGRVVRLFRTSGRNATYVGPFTLGDPAFDVRQIPSSDGPLRAGIIFNLAPLEDAALELLPTYGREGIAPLVSGWSAPSFDDYAVSRQLTGAETHASRVEFELQASFGRWLTFRGDEVKLLVLETTDGVLRPDLYNETTGEVIEAKKSVARTYVRTAIGQVLDYAHVARAKSLDLAPSILLPGRPANDILELCHSLGITVWHPDTIGFARLEPSWS
ncbi:hypothetical protein I8920_05835 [Curtobacterium sp. YC1]|uniref:hypothetical protein n=1 Tax=Curtobacterium sp. YC1 TaxID=2795488 RepID=UPI0018E507CF|nr:hypothetical protein [Curtobacterium sp. YC1]QQD77249.1 hypothetical protein I8920_05835 [Curtobacterium sp. YC1]